MKKTLTKTAAAARTALAVLFLSGTAHAVQSAKYETVFDGIEPREVLKPVITSINSIKAEINLLAEPVELSGRTALESPAFSKEDNLTPYYDFWLETLKEAGLKPESTEFFTANDEVRFRIYYSGGKLKKHENRALSLNIGFELPNSYMNALVSFLEGNRIKVVRNLWRLEANSTIRPCIYYLADEKSPEKEVRVFVPDSADMGHSNYSQLTCRLSKDIPHMNMHGIPALTYISSMELRRNITLKDLYDPAKKDYEHFLLACSCGTRNLLHHWFGECSLESEFRGIVYYFDTPETKNPSPLPPGGDNLLSK